LRDKDKIKICIFVIQIYFFYENWKLENIYRKAKNEKKIVESE